MIQSISKFFLRPLSVVFGLLSPAVLFWYHFRSTETEVVETEVVKGGLGIIPIILVLITSFILVKFVFKLLENKMLNDKSGRTAILLFSIVMLFAVFSMNYTFTTILSSAQDSFDNFVLVYEKYIAVTGQAMISVMIGIALVLIDFKIKKAG